MDFQTKLILGLIGAFFTLSGGLFGAFEIFRKSDAGRKWVERVSENTFRWATVLAEIKISSAVPELREAFLRVSLIGFVILFIGALLEFFPVLFAGGLTMVAFGIASLSLEIVSRPKSVIKFYLCILALSVLASLTFLLGGLDSETNLISGSLPHSAALFGVQSPTTYTEIFFTTIILNLIFAIGIFLSLVMLAMIGGMMVMGLVITSKISAFLVARTTKNTVIYFTTVLLVIGAIITASLPLLDLLTQPQPESSKKISK